MYRLPVRHRDRRSIAFRPLGIGEFIPDGDIDGRYLLHARPLPDLYIDGAGIDTNRSEFIKEACRGHLKTLNDGAAIAALRLEQLLAKAEQSQQRDSDIEAKLAEPGEQVDPGDLEQ